MVRNYSCYVYSCAFIMLNCCRSYHFLKETPNKIYLSIYLFMKMFESVLIGVFICKRTPF